MPYPAKTSREAILASALSLLEGENTPDAAPLTMRTLAASLGLQASSLYRHYADREHLEEAVAEEAARMLMNDIAAASAGQPPHEALRVAGQRYLLFAHRHPRLYALIHQPRPPAAATPGPGKDLWNLLLRLIGAVTGRPDDTAAVVAFWCFLHGYVGLESSGQFGLSGPGDAFERGLEALVRGL